MAWPKDVFIHLRAMFFNQIADDATKESIQKEYDRHYETTLYMISTSITNRALCGDKSTNWVLISGQVTYGYASPQRLPFRHAANNKRLKQELTKMGFIVRYEEEGDCHAKFDIIWG